MRGITRLKYNLTYIKKENFSFGKFPGFIVSRRHAAEALVSRLCRQRGIVLFCPKQQKCNETLCVSYAKEICFANFFCARCKHLACQKRSSGRGKNQFFCFGYRKKFFIRKIFFTSKTRSVLRTPLPENSLPTHRDRKNFSHITRWNRGKIALRAILPHGLW